jgi:hypothetical protein
MNINDRLTAIEKRLSSGGFNRECECTDGEGLVTCDTSGNVVCETCGGRIPAGVKIKLPDGCIPAMPDEFE